MPSWGRTIKKIIEIIILLPEPIKKPAKEQGRAVWEKAVEKRRLKKLHQVLDHAWDEALSGPSIDESYPGAGETAEVLMSTHKTKEKTAEAIIEHHREDMKGLLKSLPEDWQERIFEEDPPAQWAKEADIQQVLILHLLHVAALAQIGGHSLYLPQTQCLCFACLTGKKEALFLLKNFQKDTDLCPAAVHRLWKLRFSKPKDDTHIKFNLYNGTLQGIDRGLIGENTTEDIIAAARHIFAV